MPTACPRPILGVLPGHSIFFKAPPDDPIMLRLSSETRIARLMATEEMEPTAGNRCPLHCSPNPALHNVHLKKHESVLLENKSPTDGIIPCHIACETQSREKAGRWLPGAEGGGGASDCVMGTRFPLGVMNIFWN